MIKGEFSVENKYEQFKSIVQAMEADFVKFYDKNVNAAGTRVRKHLQELTKLSKDVRKEVTEIKNSRKVVM
jgi:hypothetical protein